MPITFNFLKSAVNLSAGTGNRTVTDTFTASGNTVTFTLSSSDADNKTVQVGGSFTPFGIGFDDANSDDVFTLRFETTALGVSDAFSGPVVIQGGFVQGSIDVTFLTVGGGSVAGGQFNGGGQDITFNGPQNVNGIRFTSSSAGRDRMGIDGLVVEGINCFCAGTRIDTAKGSKAVEDLKAGDLVRLADGRETRVLWLGRQRVDTELSNPQETNPIRISKGALGEGLPTRDLRLSPDHAVALDGYLINASALVNGSTIYQERDAPRGGFTYYHVETEAHELLLAEGVAAETFVDYKTRDSFENASDVPHRIIPEMDVPRVSAARLLPPHIRHRLTPAIAAE